MIAIIPARSGSKRVRNKNIRDLSGHPLIAYSIKACLLSKEIKRVVVSTNCSDIAKIALSYGAEIPFLRPDEISQDGSSDFGFLQHCFKEIDTEEVALIRPTSPMRNPSIMSDAIKKYNSIREKVSGFRSVHFSNHSPYKMFKMNDDNICSGYFDSFQGIKNYTNLPGQMFPKTYVPNGYIDIVKKETLLKTGTVFGDKIYGYESPNITDIDTEFEFFIASLQVRTKVDKINLTKKDKNEH